MRLKAIAVALCLAAAAPGWSRQEQAQERPTGEFSIAGSVVNQVTGEPVKFALVTAVGPGAIRSELTDAMGVFRMDGLNVGQFSLFARKPGFAGEAIAHPVLGPSREDVILRLTPLSVITGRVVDGDGEPAEGVRVQAYRSQVVDGVRKITPVSSDWTDDRGEYRIARLPKGLYYLRAAGGEDANTHVGESTAPPASYRAFEPVYFGGGRSADTAILVPIEPGAAFQADFALAFGPARSIRGRVTNLVSYREASIQLLRGQEDAGATGVSLNAANGQFEVHGVVDGAYLLRVTQAVEKGTRMRAEQVVHVSGRDVVGVTLTLAQGITLKVTQKLDARAPTEAQPGVRAPAMRRPVCLVSLAPIASDEASMGYTAERIDDGSSEIKDVFPGKYRVRLRGLGFQYISSAVFGDQDLLEKPEIVVGAVPLPPIEIVMRNDVGAISARFSGTADDVSVLLVPESARQSCWLHTSGAQNGTFSFSGLAPGNYRLHAWKKGDEVEYETAEARQLLSRTGESVRVIAGQTATVELKTLSEIPR